MTSLSGTLTIRPLCAKLIHDTETFGKMNPFCKMTLGSTTQTTKVAQRAGKFPNWQEILLFNRTKEDTLTIEVWDYDSSTQDDIVGTGSLLLSAVSNLEGWEDWVELTHNGVKAGDVKINVVFKAGEFVDFGALQGNVLDSGQKKGDLGSWGETGPGFVESEGSGGLKGYPANYAASGYPAADPGNSSQYNPSLQGGYYKQKTNDSVRSTDPPGQYGLNPPPNPLTNPSYSPMQYSNYAHSPQNHSNPTPTDPNLFRHSANLPPTPSTYPPVPSSDPYNRPYSQSVPSYPQSYPPQPGYPNPSYPSTFSNYPPQTGYPNLNDYSQPAPYAAQNYPGLNNYGSQPVYPPTGYTPPVYPPTGFAPTSYPDLGNPSGYSRNSSHYPPSGYY